MRLVDADKIVYYESIDADTLEGTGKFYAPRELIDAMPTIEKRKTGKWISRDGREDCYECSECHAVIEGDEVYWRNNYFCYHCGAKMKGEGDGRSDKQTGGN